MNIVHHASGTAFRHAQCLHCRHEIILAPQVGWIELYPGRNYDVCPDTDSARHQPDPESDTGRPYWMTEGPVAVVAARIPEPH